MKKTILTTLLAGFAIGMNAQSITDSTSNTKVDPNQTMQHYLTKSKNQKTAAWILLSAGFVATTAGVIIIGNQVSEWDLNPYQPTPDDTGPTILALSGTVAMLTSIPLFIASHKNKRKAHLYVSGQHAMISPRVQIGRIYSVGLKMPL